MKRNRIYNLLQTLLIAVLVPNNIRAFADAPFVVNQQGESFLVALLTDDAHAYFTGKKSLIDWRNETPFSLSVTAQDYLDDYKSNGLAANQKYLNKQIEITGDVDSINADDPNSPYIALSTSDPILTVDAYINSSGMAQAATYKSGQTVNLFCTGDGVSLTFPQLNNCSGEDVFFKSLNVAIQSSVDKWLRGAGSGVPYKAPEKISKFFIFLYFAASDMTNHSICEKSPLSDACESVIGKYIKANGSEFQQKYSRYRSYLGIPK